MPPDAEQDALWFKHRAWVPVAWFLSFANIAGAWFAARPGESVHATVHAALAVLFGLGAQHLALRKRATAEADMLERLQDIEARLADVDTLTGVAGRLAELEERLDFTERVLAEVRGRVQLPPRE